MALGGLFAPTGNPQYSSNPGGFGIGGVGYTPTAYSGGSGLGGGAGMYSFTPGVTSPPPPFQQPTFTNSMSQWYPGGNAPGTMGASQGDSGYDWAEIARQIRSHQQGDLPALMSQNISARGGMPGGGDMPNWGQTLNSNSWMNPLGNMASYAAPNRLQSPLGSTGGGPSVGQWPSNFGFSNQMQRNAMNSAIYGHESQYGTYPGAAGTDPSRWTMDRWGAVGPMQMNKGSMAAVGRPSSDLWNWNSNMAGGSEYAGQQLQRFGNPQTAMAAYNWGPGNVAGALSRGQPFPQSVQNYARTGVNAMVNYGQNQGYGQMSGDALNRLLR